MALNANNLPAGGGSKRPPAPALDPGSYPARVVQVISLGIQKQQPFKGEEKEPRHMLYVTYELADEFLEDDDGNVLEDKPRWISEDFPMHSLQADLAKSTKRYTALDPNMVHGGDWAQLAGTPCNIVISSRPSKKDPTRIYNNVTDVSAMRPKEAAKAPDLVNPVKVFDVDEPDMDVFWSLPQWLQDRIKENLEYGGSPLEKAVQAGKGSEGGSTPKERKPRQKAAEKVSEPVEDEEESEEDW